MDVLNDILKTEPEFAIGFSSGPEFFGGLNRSFIKLVLSFGGQ
jgi:hypothetical protein